MNDTVEGRFLLMNVQKHGIIVLVVELTMFISRMSPIPGSNTTANTINGYDATRRTQNITFENLTINGTVITNAAQGNITNNGYANNINFIASGDPVPVATPQFPSPAPINLALNRPASASSSQGRQSGFERKRQQHLDPLVCG